LVVVTQLRPISVVFTLPEQTLKDIHPREGGGQLEVLAMGGDNSAVLSKGILAVIDNQIDTTTGTIRLKATFPNEDLQLWPGQFVNVRLLLSMKKDALVVPSSVVQRGPSGTYAYVIRGDQTVEMRPVKTGQGDGGDVLIEEGLSAGEQVVVDGQYKLQNGSKIRLPSSEGTPAEDGKKDGSGTRRSRKS
jgi:multidrug efflux system membrane fusion protein